MKESDTEQLVRLLREIEKQGEPCFSEEEVARLSQYYGLVKKWNPRLHLTTITEPRKFLQRHLLEAEMAERLLHYSVNEVWDMGSGLGVPGLIIAILRPDLPVYLVESTKRKVIFLDEAAENLKLENLRVVHARFERLAKLSVNACMTVRAIEGMEKAVPDLLRIGAEAMQMIFFGSETLKDIIRRTITSGFQLDASLLPDSERRYLINLIRST